MMIFQPHNELSRFTCLLTRAVLVVWIFHGVLGGGGFLQPPSNSAPVLRSETRQAAFEGSSKSITNVLSQFLGQVTRGHQR